MPESKSIQARIAQFLANHIRQRELSYDDEIFARGFVNSLLAVQLVTFVEKEFHIEIEDDDLDQDNFRSINSIAALVKRKTATPAESSLQ